MVLVAVILLLCLVLEVPNYGGGKLGWRASAESVRFDLPLKFTALQLANDFDVQRANDTEFTPQSDNTHEFSMVNLTASPSDYKLEKSQSGLGRLKYKHPLTFSFGAVPSFNTSFTFFIETISPYGFSADGIAFALTNDEIPPLQSVGGCLGLMPLNINDRPDHTFFALEFDTYQNIKRDFIGFDDPSHSHIGINLNKLNSSYILDTSNNASSLYLYHNYYIKAWLQYDASVPSVRVWATNVTLQSSGSIERPSNPILEAPNLNLSLYIHTDRLYAIISATSGTYVQGHSLFAWSFESENDTAAAAPALPPLATDSLARNPSSSRSGSRLLLICIIAILAVLLFLVIPVAMVIIHKYRRWPSTAINYDHVGGSATSIIWQHADLASIKKYSYADFRRACNNFSKQSVVGEGGSGVVYRGELGNGMQVAVKKVKQDYLPKDFQREVEILMSLDHPNLLPLLAWSNCSTDGSQQGDGLEKIAEVPLKLSNDDDQDEAVGAAGMLLIYPFISNGSLNKYLGSRNLDVRKQLGKERRLEILCQVSNAIAYLHSNNCVHRDVKPDNILLTDGFDALVGDFGLARVGQPDRTKVTVTIAAVGTPGYVAPELYDELSESSLKWTTSESSLMETEMETAERQLVSYKVDVYSFGVLALKVATGRQHTYADVQRLKSAVQEPIKFLELLDPALMLLEESAVVIQQWRCIVLVGIRCISQLPEERPDMAKVSHILCAVRLTELPEILDKLFQSLLP